MTNTNDKPNKHVAFAAPSKAEKTKTSPTSSANSNVNFGDFVPAHKLPSLGDLEKQKMEAAKAASTRGKAKKLAKGLFKKVTSMKKNK